MNFCGRCGAQAPDGAMNCPNCGAPLQAAAPQQQPPAYGPQVNPAARPAGALGTAFFENFSLDSKLLMILIANLLALVNFAMNFAAHYRVKYPDEDPMKGIAKVLLQEGKDDIDGAGATVAFIIIFLVLYVIAWQFMILPLFGKKKFTFFNFCPLAVVSLGQFILQIVAMVKINGETKDNLKEYNKMLREAGKTTVKYGPTFCGVLYFILLAAQIGLLAFLSYKSYREIVGPRAPRMPQQPQYPQYPQYPQQPQQPQYPQQPMM
ncbi:MAG: zinc ribbon domain-containing protein [Clostridia bacterium]|nr:zinc ribbon domain-containing protein [Clostridia bacterium]